MFSVELLILFFYFYNDRGYSVTPKSGLKTPATGGCHFL